MPRRAAVADVHAAPAPAPQDHDPGTGPGLHINEIRRYAHGEIPEQNLPHSPKTKYDLLF